MRQTQRKWVEQQLLADEVTRNQALQRFISRLGAIICDLKADGWDIVATRRNGDYVYTLGTPPKLVKWEFDLIDGIRRPRKTLVPYVA